MNYCVAARVSIFMQRSIVYNYVTIHDRTNHIVQKIIFHNLEFRLKHKTERIWLYRFHGRRRPDTQSQLWRLSTPLVYIYRFNLRQAPSVNEAFEASLVVECPGDSKDSCGNPGCHLLKPSHMLSAGTWGYCCQQRNVYYYTSPSGSEFPNSYLYMVYV